MGRASRRYYRTLILGLLAMAGLVWVAIAQFDMPAAEMTQLLLGALLAAALVIAAAAVMVLLWVGLRRLLQRKSDPGQ